jgi:hypothetical protein
MLVKPPRVLREDFPVAAPANPVVAGLHTDVDGPDELPPPPPNLKSWASSLSLHATVLLVMAFWYFTPKVSSPTTLDSRLAGSEMGVEGGTELTGGLNTEFDLTPTPNPPPEPAMAPLAPALDELAKKLSSLSGAEKPSAGGGLDNPNPGAGNGDGFGLARFGQGGENINGVEVKVGDPQFTLIWDTETDLDLHVVEPGGKEIYWEDPRGQYGGELDVDNTRGFGPENIYWLRDDERTGEKVKGPGPPGEYRWFVVYYGGFGGVPKPTRWKVRIKHDGKVTVVTGRFRALNERSRTYSLRVEKKAE